MSTNKSAVLLIGHGTRIATGADEFRNLADQLQRALPDRLCAAGFLELSEPSIHQGLENLIRRGAKAITVLPGMLLAAGHLKNDIPNKINALQAEHPEVPIVFGTDLGLHPNMLRAAKDRIAAGETRFGSDHDRKNTLLMVIGRGTSDSDANSNIVMITRLLWEEMGFGWAETGYTAVAEPLMAEALEKAYALGYPRIVVLPYILFNGRLIHRIQHTVEDYQARHPDVAAVMAPYLNDHPGVLETFIARLHQAEAGQNQMHCQLCQYKEAIIGYEHRQGKPQQAHHHHAHR